MSSWLKTLGAGFGFGQNSKLELPPVPTYKEDPNFTDTQAYLKKYSEDMLQGNMPDWYKQIGEVAPETLTGGLVTGSTNDIVKRALESGAATGTGRGGALGADTMSAIGNTSATLRYNDWLRAMTGRQNLLNTGLNTESSVRSNALTNMNQENQFDQWGYNTGVNAAIMKKNVEDAYAQQVKWAGGQGVANAFLSYFSKNPNSNVVTSNGTDSYQSSMPEYDNGGETYDSEGYGSIDDLYGSNNSPVLSKQGQAKTSNGSGGGLSSILELLSSLYSS